MENSKRVKKLSRTPKKVKRIDSKEKSSNLELKSRYDRLLKEDTHLDKELEDLEKKGVTDDLRPHMEALHQYNEMKDVAQIILGYLADVENVTIKELHQKFELPME